MQATNMAQLEAMLQKEMQKAMRVASDKMLASTNEKVYGFYTEGNPKVYQRTGALGDTPRTTAISNTGNTSSFDVYLDQNHSYTTGTFTMGQVLDAAENHKYGVLGKPHFWEESEQEIEKGLDSTMRLFFSE